MAPKKWGKKNSIIMIKKMGEKNLKGHFVKMCTPQEGWVLFYAGLGGWGGGGRHNMGVDVLSVFLYVSIVAIDSNFFKYCNKRSS